MTANQAPLDPARAAALRLLAAVYGGQMTASARQEEGFRRLAPPVQARALRLADAVLRGASRVDKLWQPLVSRQPAPRVAAALRLGLVEVLALGAPDHAVVSDMAAALKRHPKTRPAAGMVNAVLRKALQGAPDWADLPAAKMSQGLRKKLRQSWGEANTAAIVNLWAEGSVPIDLCVKSDKAGWSERLGGRLLPNGALRLGAGVQVSALPGYDEGAFWVQDAAAQLAVQCAGLSAGDRVADLCAAPGGKTMHLAAAGAEVVAVDINAARLQRLDANLKRTGLKAKTVEADVLGFDTAGFDAVLLDAPCSATGTLRRHPEIPALFAARNLAGLTGLQAAMLDQAAHGLRIGGRLIYVTCSLLPEEGEDQMTAFLARQPGFHAVTPDLDLQEPFLQRSAPFIRSLPNDWSEWGGMDGFFVAVLERVA